MKTFDYHAPTTLEETFELLAAHGEDAHLMAGGTALVLLLQQGLLQPGHVVGLNDVAELRGIRRLDDGGLRIEALTTHRQAERSADVQAFCPALAETFNHVATVRIRNQATIGGNLAHADPAQDPPPMLIALNGQAVVVSRQGERRIPLDEFFVDFFETALQPGEVLVAVEVPALAAGTRVTYKKFLPRTQDDYATVSVAAALQMGSGRKMRRRARGARRRRDDANSRPPRGGRTTRPTHRRRGHQRSVNSGPRRSRPPGRPARLGRLQTRNGARVDRTRPGRAPQLTFVTQFLGELLHMYDVAIVGGGPAGASAATFTARAGLQTVLIDADAGMTRRAMVNNHLGFPDGVTGPELVDNGKAQAANAGAEVVAGKVVELQRQAGEGFSVRTEDGKNYEAKQVILTLGANPELARTAGINVKPGTEPRIKEIVDVDAQGKTSVPGVWAAGTAAGVSVHTIVTAGDGARVAINLISDTKGERYVDHDMMPRPAETPTA